MATPPGGAFGAPKQLAPRCSVLATRVDWLALAALFMARNILSCVRTSTHFRPAGAALIPHAYPVVTGRTTVSTLIWESAARVEALVQLPQMLDADVRIHLRRADVRVSEQGLYNA